MRPHLWARNADPALKHDVRPQFVITLVCCSVTRLERAKIFEDVISKMVNTPLFKGTSQSLSGRPYLKHLPCLSIITTRYLKISAT